MTTFEHIPTEILLQIVHHLNNIKTDLYACALVNKHFYTTTMSLLWHDLYITREDQFTKIITGLSLSSSSSSSSPSTHYLGQYIQSLTFYWPLSNDDLLSLIPHVPRLKHLRLGQAEHITDTSFQYVPTHCPDLTTLSLSYANITAESLVLLGQYCFKLDTLMLHSCSLRVYSAIHQVLAAFPHSLKVIDFLPPYMDGAILADFVHQLALGLSNYHRALTSLSLVNYANDYSGFVTTLNDQKICWPQLTHVTLDHGWKDDTQVVLFLERHPHITHLTLEHNDNITDRTLDAIAMLLPQLQYVSLEQNPLLTATGLCDLVKRRGHQLMQGIRCYGCGITDSDPDFPLELDPRLYYLETYDFQLSWISTKAFA